MFVEALLADFQEHGQDAVAACRKSSPHTYLQVITGLMPKDLTRAAVTSPHHPASRFHQGGLEAGAGPTGDALPSVSNRCAVSA